MTLLKIKYQHFLSVTEVDSFMSEVLRLVSLPVDEPNVEDVSELQTEFLIDKVVDSFKEVLEAYQLRIKHTRKLPQTTSLTQLDAERTAAFKGHLAYVYSCKTDVEETKRNAAMKLADVLAQFKYFDKHTNSSQSSFIRSYVATLRSEEYVEAFNALELEERTAELEVINNEYIRLSEERNITEKNIPDSPTKMRQQCVVAYRELVDLLNLARKNNKYFLYDELFTALSALTEKTQELINRRRNALETGENETIDEITDETPVVSDEEVAEDVA